jgi:hypothetical protein
LNFELEASTIVAYCSVDYFLHLLNLTSFHSTIRFHNNRSGF